MTEWIDWKGGKCPVDAKTQVDARLRRRDMMKNRLASGLDWSHWDEDGCGDGDIIAYRIVLLPTPAPIEGVETND